MNRKILAVIAGGLLTALASSAASAATCSAYTYTLSNGTTADASQVMQNFNDILSCANTSLAPLASPSFTGNVGIGTSSPMNLLDLNTTGNSSGIDLDGKLAMSGYSSNTWLRLNDNGDFSSGTYTMGILRADGGFEVGGNGANFHVDSSGNVGIGVSTPGVPLIVRNTAAQLELSFNTSIYSDLKTAGSGYLYLQPTGARVYVAEASLANSVYVYDYSGTNTAHSRLNAHDLLLEDDSGNTTAYVAGDGVSYLNGGNVGIGTTSPDRTLEVNGEIKVDTLGSGSTSLCIDGSSVIASCSSSIRYKTDVQTSPFGLSQVEKMRPVTFTWKNGDGKDFGFIAEEMAKISPLFVTYRDGRIEGVKCPQLVSVLAGAIQKQQKQIGALQAANDKQAAAMQRQQAEIGALQAANAKPASAMQQLQSAVAGLQHQVRIHTASK